MEKRNEKKDHNSGKHTVDPLGNRRSKKYYYAHNVKGTSETHGASTTNLSSRHLGGESHGRRPISDI